ncbi:MAG: hypothetical protein AAGK17_04525 [Pseudomonadota bacterium]
MAFKAVKVREIVAETPDISASNVPAEAFRDRYDLSTALGVVREMETSAGRAAVYEEIKNKNTLYRLVDAVYEGSGASFFQPLFLFIYMIKCVVSLGPFKNKQAQAVSIANFPNEHKTIARISALIPDIDLMQVSVERKHILAVAQLKAAVQMLGAFPRVWSFLRALVRQHSFMPAARITSTLAYYIRFSHLFAQAPDLKAAIIASNYSPEAVGMAAAAHRHGRKVIYSPHAPVPANGPVVPPVYADCALFYGEETRKTYERRNACTAQVTYIGEPGQARPMEWQQSVSTIGIFLTSGTKVEVLKSLIATIRVDLPDVRIIIRQHPVQLLSTDFSGLELDDPKTELTLGNPLDDEIKACDLVICGNSGVAMNVLSGGRPVAYLSSLDGILFDSNGFVGSRLVFNMSWWSGDIYDRLKGFYEAPGWLSVMQTYDASYAADTNELSQTARTTLLKHLTPTTGKPTRASQELDKIAAKARRT